MGQIVFIRGGGERRVSVIDRVVIGRDPSSEIHLEDPMVSLKHAEVIATSEGVELRDLGSRHGTYVRDERVKSIRLADGDEILIGVHKLRFEEPRLGPLPLARPAVESRTGFVPASEIRDEAELRAGYEKLRAALEIASLAGAEREVRPLLERILQCAITVIGAERTAAVLVDPANGGVLLRLAMNRDPRQEPASLSTKLLSEVLGRGKGMLVEGTVVADRRSESMAAQGIRSAMCAPLLYHDQVLGLLYVDSRIFERSFDERDLELLMAFANQAAAALKVARSVEEVERVRARERARMEQVLRHLPEGVFLLDGERGIVFANETALRLAPSLRITPGRPIPDPLEGIELAELAGGVVHRLKTRDRPARVLELTGTRAEEAGAGEGILLVVRDVTEERQREEQASRHERLATIGKLVAGVAHDFNNLLTVILTSADAVAEEAPAEQRGFAQDISDAGTRAARLTRQLLSFTSGSSGRVEVVDITQLAEEMGRSWSRLLDGRLNVLVRTEGPPALVLADRSHLEQALLNLIVNARDACAPGGHLWLEVRTITGGAELPAPRTVELIARDDGAGLPPGVGDRIFEPFFTTKGDAGTGLGLTTVQRVVRAAGGVISVDSPPGGGTAFRLLFPAADPVTEEAGASARPAVRPGTILLVEEHPAVREASARALRAAGHDVLTAASGPEALRAAATHGRQIDLLVTGLILPGMSGQDLAAELRRGHGGLGVLYVSGFFDDAVIQRARDEGADFLPKPFGAQALCDRAAETLARARGTV